MVEHMARYAICYECDTCGEHTTQHDKPNYFADARAVLEFEPFSCGWSRCKGQRHLYVIAPAGFYY